MLEITATKLKKACSKRDPITPQLPTKLKEGDRVLIKNQTAGPFNPKYVGNYRIVSLKGNQVELRLVDGRKTQMEHVSNVKYILPAEKYIDTTPWCIYVFFINNLSRIQQICHMKLKSQNADLAYSLDGYLWAISSLTITKIQIRCLRNNTVVEIKPPLQIVDIENGCKGYALNLCIPTKTELTATMVLPT